jgi:hypothetical protein
VRSNLLERFGETDSFRNFMISGHDGEQKAFFSGEDVRDRMNMMRRSINEIRGSWERYPVFMQGLRELMSDGSAEAPDAGDREAVVDYHDRLTALLGSRKVWGEPTGDYEAIRLYTSNIGYNEIFAHTNATFRSGNPRGVLSATFMTELLNIDLFNYRQVNSAADNFEGVVYRGMSMSDESLAKLYELIGGNISGRYVSIPLITMSASRDVSVALEFAAHSADREAPHLIVWEIHVHSLAADLLRLYRAKYPNSVVTSLCAVPIHGLSDIPVESEVLLRGPFFQILNTRLDNSLEPGRPVHRITAVMLNSNRDHLTAITSNRGEGYAMRELFRTLVGAGRSTRCAEHLEEIGSNDDAAAYRTEAAKNYAAINSYL